MSGVTADHQVALPTSRSSWLSATFLHWPVPADSVQALLPQGLTVDQYDGSAWLSMTPFVLADLRPLGRPLLPGVGAVARWWPLDFPRLPRIPETNLRTYVCGPDGHDGLWFFSLHAGSAALVLAGRVGLGAPYKHGDMTVCGDGGRVRYAGRLANNAEVYRLEVTPGEPVTPSERDVWLTGRWRTYTRNGRVLLATPVQHEPWPLRSVNLDLVEQNLTDSTGLPKVQHPSVVHFSEGVRDVRVGVPRPVG
jgi:uncharacterized protein YqjF (DUF2071 family)